jgi:N-acetylmuramoyl-L-alanine amidase
LPKRHLQFKPLVNVAKVTFFIFPVDNSSPFFMSPPLFRAKEHAAAGYRVFLAAFLLAVPFLVGCTDADAAANNTTDTTVDTPTSAAAPAPVTLTSRATPPPPATTRAVTPAPAPAPAQPVASATAGQRVNLNATLARWGLVRDPVAPAGTAIWRKTNIGVKVEFRGNKADAILNGTHVWLGSPVSEVGGIYRMSRADFDNTLLPVLAPVSALAAQPAKPLRHVFLDPGHGGDDTGCDNKALGLQEKALTLDVARRVKFILERRGLKVTLSRTRDVFVALPDRPALAKKVGADIFVSIHFNSQGVSGNSVSGIETFVLAPQGQHSTNVGKGSISAATLNARDPGHANNVLNTILGYQVQAALAAKIKTGDRGLRRARMLAVLRRATCPAVLIECGFVTNPSEAGKIKLPAHREKIAQGIADGIFRYQKLVDAHAAAAAKRKP